MKAEKDMRHYFAILYISIIIISIKYGPITPFYGDLYVYKNFYESFGQDFRIQDYFALRKEPLFFFFMYLISAIGPFTFYVHFHSCLFFASVMKTISDYSVNFWRSIAVMLPIVLYFSPFISLSGYILRQGEGFIFLFLSGFYLRDLRRWKSSMVMILVAAGFHVSFFFYFPVLIMIRLLKNGTSIARLWALSAILYVADVYHYLSFFLSGLDLSAFMSSDGTDDFVVGFKYKYLLFSLIPFVFYMFRFYRNVIDVYPVWRQLWFIYLVSNALGFTFSWFPFYNRVMYFSWVLIPFMFIPCVDQFFAYHIRRKKDPYYKPYVLAD
jgi:hypothetical protein